MSQRYIASTTDTKTFANGAVGHWSQAVGYLAKVINCPVHGLKATFTAYATSEGKACTRVNGKHIGGFFAWRDGSPEFVPYDRYRRRAGLPVAETVQAHHNSRWYAVSEGEPQMFIGVYDTEQTLVEAYERVRLDKNLPHLIVTKHPAHSTNKGQAK